MASRARTVGASCRFRAVSDDHLGLGSVLAQRVEAGAEEGIPFTDAMTTES